MGFRERRGARRRSRERLSLVARIQRGESPGRTRLRYVSSLGRRQRRRVGHDGVSPHGDEFWRESDMLEGTLLYRFVPVLMTTSRLFRKRMYISFIASTSSLRRSRKSPGHLGLLRLPPFDEPRLRNRVRLHRGRMTQHANAAASEYPPTRTALVLQSSPSRPPEPYPSTFKPPSLCSARILSIRAGASSMPSVRWMSPRVPSVVAWVPEPRVRIPEPPRITSRER